MCSVCTKVFEFEKNVIEREPKGSNFEKTWLKPVPEKLSHKFLNCPNWRRGSLKKEEQDSTG